MLVSLNDAKVYHYKSEDYFEDIHKVYFGAASRNNDDFIARDYTHQYRITNEKDVIAIKHILQEKQFLPIQINEDCIVGWGERYYKENPSASKGDFIGDNTGKVRIIGEIREPKHFKGLILPYKGSTNERFKYLMDKLNDKLRKKDLGAFYTPILYCKKAAELVRMAIDKVPQGNDYIILDRCAGTGNLESVLTEDELSHCILSTFEYYEYKVLCERLGDKVRFIIPPTENLVEYCQGLIKNADALSEQYIQNESIAEYINNERCTIILFENPPYQDSSAITFTDENNTRAKTSRNESFVKTEFKKEINQINEQRGAAREISNLFIWSAFKYYLRQPTDSYICFSPVKYFKSIHLVEKEFVKGFLFNRKHFHASPSALSCILWANVSANDESWTLDAYDIENREIKFVKEVVVKRVLKPISEYNDRRKNLPGDMDSSIMADSTGYIKVGGKIGLKLAVHNENIIGYMAANGYSIDAKHRYLMRLPYCVGVEQSFGFYLRIDNYQSKLPIFCAKLFPEDTWYKKDVYFTSADKGDEYISDTDLIRSCLIFVCLSDANKCLSLRTSNGFFYQNELCLDSGTKASCDLEKMKLSKRDKDILSIWDNVMQKAKQVPCYDETCKYGTYQIKQELNTYSLDERKKKIYDYPELNSAIVSLKMELKKYYIDIIMPLLLKYELIK